MLRYGVMEVRFPLMPKGVEHATLQGLSGWLRGAVRFPLMPKGVEHDDIFGLKKPDAASEISFDAERR